MSEKKSSTRTVKIGFRWYTPDSYEAAAREGMDRWFPLLLATSLGGPSAAEARKAWIDDSHPFTPDSPNSPPASEIPKSETSVPKEPAQHPAPITEQVTPQTEPSSTPEIPELEIIAPKDSAPKTENTICPRYGQHDRTRFFCMDCNNFQTTACPHPDQRILDDPTKDFCPNFDNGKPQQPIITSDTSETSKRPSVTPSQIQPSPSPEPQIPQITGICPKCHQPGSAQQKEIPSGNSNKTHLYWYYGHYDPKKSNKLRWCYIGKNLPV